MCLLSLGKNPPGCGTCPLCVMLTLAGEAPDGFLAGADDDGFEDLQAVNPQDD